MYPVKLDIDFKPGASRLELLVRLPYLLAWGVIIKVIGVAALVISIAQILHILVLGRRNRMLFNLYYTFFTIDTRLTCYSTLLVDARPPILGPEGIGGTLIQKFQPGSAQGEPTSADSSETKEENNL